MRAYRHTYIHVETYLLLILFIIYTFSDITGQDTAIVTIKIYTENESDMLGNDDFVLFGQFLPTPNKEPLYDYFESNTQLESVVSFEVRLFLQV